MTALLPPRARRMAVPVVLGCALLVGLVGGVVLTQPAALRLDTTINQAILRAVGRYQAPLDLVAGLGEKVDVGVVIVVLVGICLARRRLNGALLAAIAIPVAPALTEFVLKPLFARPQMSGAFPSGHTTAAFAVATVVAVLLATPDNRISGIWRLAIGLAALLAAAAVGIAVIGLGIHTTVDAIGGAAVGGGVALSVAVLLDLPLPRRLLALAVEALRVMARRFRGEAI
jgi:undecaprenyl-diphosphatase